MGLVRGMARTAVVAGTATAVSNRVSRRQAGRWNEAQAPAAPPPPAPAAYAAPPPPAAAPAESSLTSGLQELAALHQQGVLTDAEFAAAKARLLGA
jgi:hypothetical protein